jgi:phosphate uptake regulator/thiamine kinase-like enzyme
MATEPTFRQRTRELVTSMAGAVQSQLKAATSAVIDRDAEQARKVIERDDYVDNLYTYTETELSYLLLNGQGTERLRPVRLAMKVAEHLEDIADNAENIAKQALHIRTTSEQPLLLDIRYCYQEAKKGISMAVEAFVSGNMKLARTAARHEASLDVAYRDMLKQALEALGKPGCDAKFLLTQLFVAKYLEKIGDKILEIAEEALALITGEKLKLHQITHLNRMLRNNSNEELNLEGLWGTRSGSTVFKLERNAEQSVIYKDGNIRKIGDEIAKIEEWDRIEPGLVPDVLRTFEHKSRKVMVTSFFEGQTLQEIYTTAWWPDKEQVTGRLARLLDRIWTRSLSPDRPDFDAVNQIRTRLEAVYTMHERLQTIRGEAASVCGIEHDSLNQLLQRLEKHSNTLRAPFTVYTHGDFNTDNVLYRAQDERLHFVDVHRSGYGDYLTDVSVFLCSNLRRPTVSGMQRLELERVNGLVMDYARRFADTWGDELFEERLAVLMGRSLITSTRFVANYMLARELYLLGIEKLEWALEKLEGKY